MNCYEQHLEQRKERYLELAEKMQERSEEAYERSNRIASVIPMGQPILVGHHSEAGHRADLKKIENAMRSSIENANKAKYYEHKATSVGKGGISSDDPEAITKLELKLKDMIEDQAMMKAVNKAHASFLKDPSSIEKAEIPEKYKDKIRNYKPQYSWEPHPFPPYAIQNNNANMRRVKERMAELQKASQRTEVVKEHDGIEYREEDNRVHLIFPGKPSEEIRTILKRYGFKWSPSRGSWVRFLNNSGIYAAQQAMEQISKEATNGK